MAKQTVTLRLDEDDLTYLSQTEIAGAANFSEKIRALLAQARQLREGMESFAAAHEFARDLFARAERAVNSAEIEAGIRSELVHRVLAWLPEMTALVLSSPRTEDEHAALKHLEQQLAERVFALVDSMLQLARADFPGCHAPQTLAKRSAFAVKSVIQDQGESS